MSWRVSALEKRFTKRFYSNNTVLKPINTKLLYKAKYHNTYTIRGEYKSVITRLLSTKSERLLTPKKHVTHLSQLILGFSRSVPTSIAFLGIKIFRHLYQ